MWLLIALTSLAMASPPDKAPAAFGDPGDDARGVFAAESGAVVVATSDGKALVLGTNKWTLDTWSGCTATAVTARISGATGDADVWVGCDDGEIHGLSWDEEEGLEVLSDDEGDFVYELSQDEDEKVHAMFWDEDAGSLYIVSEVEDGTLYGHELIPDDDTLDASSSYPVQLAYDNFADAAMSSTRIIVAHGSDEVSCYSLAGGSVISSTTNGPVDYVDIVASTWDTIYGVDSKGYLVQYALSSMTWTILRNDLDDEFTGLAMSFLTDEEWILLGNGDLAQVYPMSGSVLGSSTPEVEFDLPSPITDAVVGADAYVYATSEDGQLLVLTSRPWISDVSTVPTAVSEGDTLTVYFTVDEAGEAEVRRGGDRSASGDLLWQGDVEAGTHEVEIEVDGDWGEGENAVFVFVSDSDGRGHGATSVDVDNPPDPPELTDEDVGLGDGYLVLSIEGISDEDLASYTVYVSTTSFEPSDWATGGPDFDGETELEAPIVVEAEGGEDVDVRITPLTNGQTYYLAVRATDEGGLEGDMSDVVSGTPKPTYSAAEAAGEEGGYPECGPGLGAVGWLVLLGAGVAVRRRRHLAAAVLASALVVPSVASAGERREDATPAVGNFEIHYGKIKFEDAVLQQYYGDTANDMVYVEIGPQFFRVLEIDMGFGFYQDLAYKRTEDDEQGSERNMFTFMPLSLSGTLRAHILDEQLLVPFGTVGFDYAFFSDKFWDSSLDEPDTTSKAGAKTGWHWAVGGNLLLDFFAPGRAATLETQSGINDTFLVFEYRQQKIDNGSGFDFAGRVISVGLKLDF